MVNSMLNGNDAIEKALLKLNADHNEKNLRGLVKAIQKQMAAGRHFLLPIEYPDPEDDRTFSFRSIPGENGEVYLACFTGEDEVEKGEKTAVMSYFIDSFIEMAIDQEAVSGIMINPFGCTCRLPKSVLQMIHDAKPPHEDDYLRENFLLEKAIHFATTHHAGQLRKGTHVPYIVHPLETMGILRSMNADTNLLIAGLLHDTIEDTAVTHDDILERFGTDVVALVDAHSEDKNLTWDERKSHAIKELKKAPKRLKMLVMADKVSNLRSIAADYRVLGEKLWERFNAPAEKQAWYYSGIQDALWDMQLEPDTAHVYWEMVGLYKDIFVTYYRSWPDEDYFGEHLIQAGLDGGVYRLDRGDPEWKPMKEFEPDSASRIQICREEAERLEDEWNRPFWDCVEGDLTDGTCTVLRDEKRVVFLTVKDGGITLTDEGVGYLREGEPEEVDYEHHVWLDQENTKRLIIQLRREMGVDMNLKELFLERFGLELSSSEFVKYCKKKKVKHHFLSL